MAIEFTNVKEEEIEDVGYEFTDEEIGDETPIELKEYDKEIIEMTNRGPFVQIRTSDPLFVASSINKERIYNYDTGYCKDISVPKIKEINNIQFVGSNIDPKSQSIMVENYEKYITENKKIAILGNQELNSPLREYVEVVDYNPPIKEIFKDIVKEANIDESILDHASGLTPSEFRRALMSNTDIYQYKCNKLKNMGIDIIDTTNELPLKDIKGLDTLINYIDKSISSGKGKGILIFGVPGSGKSQLVKSIGHDKKIPIVNLNMGLLKGSYVGETEHKTKTGLDIINTIGKTIVFIDEIDKALSGVSDNSNNSTSKSQGGIFLNWMQERNIGDSYVIATANDIQALPPEYLRSERWDAIFFIDIPSKEVQQELCLMYCEKYGITSGKFSPDVYTGAEIKTICRTADMLDITLEEASTYVKPIAKSSRTLSTTRQWANSNCIVL